MTFHLNRASNRLISQCLLLAALLLTTLSLVGQLFKHRMGHTRVLGFVQAFYLDNESSVPTWYSTFLLGLAAVLLGAIALAKHASGNIFRWHWSALCGLFWLLSVDEVATIHEFPIEPIRQQFGLSGVLYYGWVLPAAALVSLCGICLVGFLRHLRPRTRALTLLAGALYLSGALGVEMVSGYHASVHGEDNLRYSLIITFEELLEMTGVVTLIYGMLDCGISEYGEVTLSLSSEASSVSSDGSRQ